MHVACPRVAVISSVHRWNDTRIFVRQAASLAAHGYRVVLAAIGDQAEPFEASGVRVIPLPRRRRSARWITWFSILRIVVRERATVVHAHDPELLPLLLLLKMAGRRVVYDVHENVSEQVLHKEWVPRPMRRPLSALLKTTQRFLPRVVDAVILAEDSYARHFPAAANVVIVRNFPVLPPGHKRDYRSDMLRMVYVGDVRKVRGIDEAVALTERLARLRIPVALRVVGSFADASEERNTLELVRRLGVERQIQFLGRRPPHEIPALIEDCDVGLALLHPIGNYRESYPTKMFEYMAAGIPVVASRFALWQAVLEGNECGRVIDPQDVNEAVEAMLSYWSSPTLRERHGRNGRSAVERTYHWGRETPMLFHVYANLLRVPPGDGGKPTDRQSLDGEPSSRRAGC